MYATITETRYSQAVLYTQIEYNSGLIVLLIGGAAIHVDALIISLLSFLLGGLFHLCAFSLAYRGLSYKIWTSIAGERDWVLDDLEDIDLKEMRETGSVEIEVPG